ncbi:phospholipase D family protein [bacterium]|nr:phospholipase D family protein [bacterium]
MTPAIIKKVFFASTILLLLGVEIAFCAGHTEQIDGSTIDVCFSSSDYCRGIILDAIDSAQEKIDVAVYSFTNLELSKALIKAHLRGVAVRVITDNLQSRGRYSKSQFLADSGIPVRLDDDNGYMHHKFAVFDGKSVIFGSYNWSNSAEDKNDENLLFLRDKNVARDFEDEFERLWQGYK